MRQLLQFINTRIRKDQKGATVVEYAIMLALVAVAVALAAPNVTNAVTGVFDDVVSVLSQ